MGFEIHNCINHPVRPTVIVCSLNRAFCQECMDTKELRCGTCGYCPHRGNCAIQWHCSREALKAACDDKL